MQYALCISKENTVKPVFKGYTNKRTSPPPPKSGDPKNGVLSSPYI